VYTLTEDNRLFFEYEAITDKASPINLTNHVYWNLSGDGSGNILDHEIQLNCEQYIPVNDVQIPLGKLEKTAGTAFDFTKTKRIGLDIDAAGGYDHCWVTENYNPSIDGMGTSGAAESVSKNQPFAILSEKKSGRKLYFHTSQPGVQFYTGNFLNNESGRAGIYNKNAGLCLETQNFPDAPNQRDFPSSILRPGKKYIHSTMISFSTT
jgi:aldose 1-epimerase